MTAVVWLLAFVTVQPQVEMQVPDTSTRADSTPVAAAAAGPVLRVIPLRIAPPRFIADSAIQERPHAIEYSKLYETRLAIHHWASFATLPLFAAEYVVGQKLIRSASPSASLNSAHQVLAASIAGLFAVNTVTGGWNLWDSRKDPNGRVRRYVHSALMIISDAGFLATAGTAPDDDRFRTGSGGASLHRTLAITSMSAALAGYAMMLVWKN